MQVTTTAFVVFLLLSSNNGASQLADTRIDAPRTVVLPFYPNAARDTGRQGLFRVTVEIGESGDVGAVRIRDSQTPRRSDVAFLEPSIVASVSRWKYAVGGRRSVDVEFSFVLFDCDECPPKDLVTFDAPGQVTVRGYRKIVLIVD